MKPLLNLAVLVAALVVLAGCDEDERVVKLAQENTRQQAEQNKQMAGVNKELAESRKEQAGLQRDLGQQQADLNAERDKLEAERRQIERDPIIASAIAQGALILACLIPLVLVAFLVHRLRDSAEQDSSGLLIEELTSERPLLLPALPHTDDQHDHHQLSAPVQPEQI